MISDRLIEEDSLVVDGGRVAIDVRIPWYRAVPASCIADVEFSVDGRKPEVGSVRCTLNGIERTIGEFPELVNEQWFPTDALRVSGDLAVEVGVEHEVSVELKLFIPYIVTAHGVLMIDEKHSLRMTAVPACVPEAVK